MRHRTDFGRLYLDLICPYLDDRLRLWWICHHLILIRCNIAQNRRILKGLISVVDRDILKILTHRRYDWLSRYHSLPLVNLRRCYDHMPLFGFLSQRDLHGLLCHLFLFGQDKPLGGDHLVDDSSIGLMIETIWPGVIPTMVAMSPQEVIRQVVTLSPLQELVSLPVTCVV